LTRAAIVTGAARGLGFGIAQRLLADGWEVALVDQSQEVLGVAQSLADERAQGFVLDVSDPQACIETVTAIAAAFPEIRGLVNNAGIGGPSTLVHETEPDAFRRVIEVNLLGPFHMARAAVPHLENHGKGASIVNITSILGQQGAAGTGPYSASKGGLALLGQSMAMELAGSGIRVNSIAPGNMLTVMHEEHVQWLADTQRIDYDEALAQVRSSIPVGRHGTPADIAHTVAWLLSDDSSYVTGQTIGVNGGVILT
jgi:NAD(P)-dependent dehydrogenase (short-subunit alcohol dehydrogenase family)